MSAYKARSLLETIGGPMILLRVAIAVSIFAGSIAMSGCRTTCAVITRFDAAPQWVCPGKDFSPEIHLRVENLDQDNERSADGVCLVSLWETTVADHNQPGSVPLITKLGPLANPSPGVHETPSSGVHVVSGSLVREYRFSLIATNTDCGDDGEEYLRKNQGSFEKAYGIDLDDREVMTAHTKVKLISTGEPQRLCVPHAVDVQGGFTWVKDEIRAGMGIVIAGVENPNAFPLEVKHMLPPPSGTVYEVLKPGAKTTAFDGRTPNGNWAIKTLNEADYTGFMKHGLKHMGEPSICIVVGLMCQ